MNNFTYHSPTKYIFGKNTITKIGQEVENYKCQKVLLLYGGGSIFKNGVYEQTVNSLKNSDIQFVELGGVKPNPVLSKVHEAIELCKQENVDGIIAVGGGSVLDSAKVIASGVYFNGDIWDVFERKVAPPKDALPIFSILTISATGSENNPFAVITKEDENKKWAFSAGEVSFPRVSIIDPSAQFSLPKKQTAYGAIDMMSHIFEFYFLNDESNTLSSEILEGLLRTIIDATPVLLQNPEDYERRSELALAGTLALSGMHLSAIGNGDWASHGIEHALSALYDIPHGAGLAIVFPAWMKYVYKKNLSQFVRYTKKVWQLEDANDEETALLGIDKTMEFFKQIGAPVSLPDANIPVEAIEDLAENAAMNTPLGSLVKLYKQDILNILKFVTE